jgi:hypothetical protein
LSPIGPEPGVTAVMFMWMSYGGDARGEKKGTGW